MAGIDPISGIARGLGAISNSKPMKILTKQFQKNPEGALAATTVTSIVVKDGIGCYKYVTQSKNNKEIPPERRAFVTSLDLTNGLLMIGTQIAMFYMMRKYSEPLFNKLFKRSYGDTAKRDLLSWIRMVAKKENVPQPKKTLIEKHFDKNKKENLDLFKFIFDVGVATIVAKRIITPFIATPLAGIVQKRFFPIEEEGAANTETGKTEKNNIAKDIKNDNIKEVTKKDDTDDIEEDDD